MAAKLRSSGSNNKQTCLHYLQVISLRVVLLVKKSYVSLISVWWRAKRRGVGTLSIGSLVFLPSSLFISAAILVRRSSRCRGRHDTLFTDVVRRTAGCSHWLVLGLSLHLWINWDILRLVLSLRLCIYLCIWWSWVVICSIISWIGGAVITIVILNSYINRMLC